MVSPHVTLSLSDTPSEIFQKAQQLISERTSELSELPKSIEKIREGKDSIYEQTKKVALLATESDDEDDLDSQEFKPVLYSSFESARFDAEGAVRDYLKASGNAKIDITDASAHLNLPVDLVEQAYIKVLSERRFTTNSSATVKQKNP